MASIGRTVTNADNVPTIVHLAIDVSQTISVGGLVESDGTSRKGELATAASSTIVGIAMESITTGGAVTAADTIPVALVRNQVVRIPFITSGSKKTFADTDKYTTAYDLEDENSIDPDDTT